MLPKGNIPFSVGAMSHIIDNLFSTAVLPGTILLGVCLAYWVLLIAGAVDLDLLDFDIDADMDADTGGSSWGMTAFKFLNFNDVPLMIWLTIFAISYVAGGLMFVSTREVTGEWGEIAAGIAGTTAIALVATKLLTQPLRGKFDSVEPNVAETLVGRRCVITTSEVSDRFGQARVESDGAPLLLNVRGPSDLLAKNDVAVITSYDSARNIFYVEPVPVVSSEPPHQEAL